jgi:hypothetical protein
LACRAEKDCGPAARGSGENFFDGLLREGQVRVHLADLHKVASTDVALILVIAGPMVYPICLNSRPPLRFIEQKFTVPAE